MVRRATSSGFGMLAVPHVTLTVTGDVARIQRMFGTY
jgi:hypothetical protein